MEPASAQLEAALTRTLYRSPAEISKQSDSTFVRAFFLLPPERRAALEAIYAFARVLDDAVDDWKTPALQTRALSFWEGHFAAMTRGQAEGPVFTQLARALSTFQIPIAPFEALFHGCKTDIEKTRYASFSELEAYCEDVASSIGLMTLPVFGVSGPGVETAAIALGKALQLVNILRDVEEDWQRGRLYLPLEDLTRFGYRPEALSVPEYTPAFRALMAFEAERAQHFFDAARPHFSPPAHRGAIAPWLMAEHYYSLLQSLKRSRFAVFGHKHSAGRSKRLLLLCKTLKWMTTLPPVPEKIPEK